MFAAPPPRVPCATVTAPVRPGYFQYRMRDGVLQRRVCAGASGGFAPLGRWVRWRSMPPHPLDAGARP